MTQTIDSLRAAWEAGKLYRSRESIPAHLLRSQIYRAWERSHLQGANPRSMQAEQLSLQETERLLEQNQTLIKASRPYFRMLSQAAGQEHHAVMLGDHNAILLDVIGDEQTVNGPHPFPTSGSLLSEGVAGANGIGTPLAEAGYVEIAATEHFIEGFHPFSCQGIPLYNEKRDIAGVLSISVRRSEVGQRLREILLCASHGIEADLMIANLEQDIHQVLTASPDEYEPLEKLKQDLLQSHQAARLKLEMSSRLVARSQLDYALQLIGQAESAIALFRRRARLWHDLASLDQGQVKAICLPDTIDDLIDLLKTELTIRKIEIITCWYEPIFGFTDDKKLIRQLLRCFLQAFDQAGEGGKIIVKVEKRSIDEFAQISFVASSIPLLLGKSQPLTQMITLPLAPQSL